MANLTRKHTFQMKKRHFARRLFQGGLDASSYVLLHLQETGQSFFDDFLGGLPNSYPGFALMQWIFGVGKYKKPNFKEATVRTNLQRLIKDGLVSKSSKEKVYCLTDKGEKFVSYIENRYLILKEPWDKKLRIVIFDIPENKKYWRRLIRQELLLLQFQQLQKSVYVGKCPIPDSFCKELEQGGVAKHIFIFTIDKVDRKEEILKLLESEQS